MTALDEVQKVAGELAALGRGDQPPSHEKVLEAVANLRKTIGA